jgi:hypothetical protein
MKTMGGVMNFVFSGEGVKPLMEKPFIITSLALKSKTKAL